MKRIAVLLAFFSISLAIFAQKELLGEWKTVNEQGVEEGVVRIFKATDGLYYGKLERLLQAEYAGKGFTCVKCKGDDKNKPIEGLIIIRSMRYEDGKLVGGNVLDPNSGNTYYGSIWLDEKTGNLVLRGSIDKRGILGRSQTWKR